MGSGFGPSFGEYLSDMGDGVNGVDCVNGVDVINSGMYDICIFDGWNCLLVDWLIFS
jgi:hypothetical protein